MSLLCLKLVLILKLYRLVLGPSQPPIQWVMEITSLGVKRPEHEADHLHSSSAEVKNAWSYTSNPQYAFMVLNKKSQGKLYRLRFMKLITSEIRAAFRLAYKGK
jgi:hypothetical protein